MRYFVFTQAAGRGGADYLSYKSSKRKVFEAKFHKKLTGEILCSRMSTNL